MVHAGLVPAEMWKPGDKDEYVTVYAFLKSGTLRLALGAWKGSVPSAALAELGSSQSFWCWVAERVVAKGQAVENVESVRAKFSGGDLQRSEEHTSELQSLMRISYAVFCLKK